MIHLVLFIRHMHGSCIFGVFCGTECLLNVFGVSHGLLAYMDTTK